MLFFYLNIVEKTNRTRSVYYCRPLCNSVCIFLVKVSNIHFLVEECILSKKKDVYIFFLSFNVTMTSQNDVPIFSLFKARKWSVMNSSRHKHELFDQMWEFYW